MLLLWEGDEEEEAGPWAIPSAAGTPAESGAAAAGALQARQRAG